jgi:hypothetical protein
MKGSERIKLPSWTESLESRNRVVMIIDMKSIATP